MKLNWFSPLPPAQTDIGHYTARILPVLLDRAQVTLWTDQVEWDFTLTKFGQVCSYKLEEIPWCELNRGDIAVYHIGNNARFHRSIWEVSPRHPGITVLHDMYLQNFFVAIYRDRNDPEGYLARMQAYYGPTARLEGQSLFKGDLNPECLAEKYPLTSLAVQNSTGVIVHTHEGFESLKRLNRCPVIHLPLPYPASPLHGSASERLVKYTGTAPYRLVMCGYLGPHRGVDLVLRALADFPLKQNFRLDVYGNLWDVDFVKKLIRSLGLEDQVTLHGFVPEPELDAALAKAHLGINIRCPTMGEASGAQLRLWDHALPVLVSKSGWYADLPQDVVAFVRPSQETLDIQAHLSAFLADPLRFARMGEKGRQLLEERHSPVTYAEMLLAFTADAIRFRSRAVAHKLAWRVGTEASVWLDSRSFPFGLEGAARQIYSIISHDDA